MSDKEDDFISISLDDAQIDSSITGVYVSDDLVIDLSNMGAAQSTFSITNTNSGTYNFGNYGNITIGNDFNNSTPEVVISDGKNGVKLLETLKTWSKALNMPLIYDTPLENPVLREIHDSWIDAMNRGDKKACAQYAKQFEMINDLTKND